MAYNHNSLKIKCAVIGLFTIFVVAYTGQVSAKTDVVLTPQSLSLSPGQSANIEVKLDSTVGVLGMDMIVKFDPANVIIDKVEAGKFWQKPQIMINRIDAPAGKVYLSIFSYPAGSGNGSVANLTVKQNSTNNSTIQLDNQTLFAGVNGQRISYTTKNVSITGLSTIPTSLPTVILSPTQSVQPTPSSTISPTPGPSVNVAANVAPLSSSSAEVGPTILLEETPTPAPVKTKISSGFTLQLVALFLLIFGTLAFFTFKKNF